MKRCDNSERLTPDPDHYFLVMALRRPHHRRGTFHNSSRHHNNRKPASHLSGCQVHLRAQVWIVR